MNRRQPPWHVTAGVINNIQNGPKRLCGRPRLVTHTHRRLVMCCASQVTLGLVVLGGWHLHVRYIPWCWLIRDDAQNRPSADWIDVIQRPSWRSRTHSRSFMSFYCLLTAETDEFVKVDSADTVTGQRKHWRGASASPRCWSKCGLAAGGWRLAALSSLWDQKFQNLSVQGGLLFFTFNPPFLLFLLFTSHLLFVSFLASSSCFPLILTIASIWCIQSSDMYRLPSCTRQAWVWLLWDSEDFLCLNKVFRSRDLQEY